MLMLFSTHNLQDSVHKGEGGIQPMEGMGAIGVWEVSKFEWFEMTYSKEK